MQPGHINVIEPCLGKLDVLGWTHCLATWSDWIKCVDNEYNGISNSSRWHFPSFLCLISLWLHMKNVWEELFTSVLIFTPCMDAQSEWLSVSCWIKTLEQRSPYVRLHVPMTTGLPLWKCMKTRIISVCREKQIYKVRQLLVIWSVSMHRWERWSVHKNTVDVHTNTESKQTLLQVEMMNILCTYMETTVTVVVLWYIVESTSLHETASILCQHFLLQMMLSA